jgi:hypothetical protein
MRNPTGRTRLVRGVQILDATVSETSPEAPIVLRAGGLTLPSGNLQPGGAADGLLASRSPARARTLLYGLLAVDAIVIVLGILYVEGVVGYWRFSISTQRSLSEFVQYAKYGTAAALLVWHGRTRTTTVWALLFTFLFLDDAFQVHERLGLLVSVRGGLPQIGGMEPRQLGETVVAGVYGVIFISALAWASWQAGARDRILTITLVAALLLLAAFGVGVDALNSLLAGHRITRLLNVVEDGGEMLSASLQLYIVWMWGLRSRRDD